MNTSLADGDALPERQRVSLTFDNGPTPGVTEAVLDALRTHEMTATFFVIGTKLAAPGGRALAERAHGEGHRIGNHTLTHSIPLGQLAGTDALGREIDGAQALLGSLADPERLFRPYASGGTIDRRMLGAGGRAHLMDGGYTCCLWNCLPRDWLDPHAWTDTCTRMLAALDWAVVVLHDLPTGAMEHLPGFLGELRMQDVEVRADFPDSCIPIRSGAPTSSFSLLDV